MIAVAGGSLGARRINEAVVALASRGGPVARGWPSATWSARRGDYADVSRPARRLPCRGGLVYEQVPFEDRMDLLLAAADVAVQRAGASTVFELTAVGLPSILVPLPGAPGDHQPINARRMVEAGAAVLVPDPEPDRGPVGRRARPPAGPRRGPPEDGGERLVGLAYPAAADAVAALAEEHARA